ncbi:MAG: 16S rRNA (guanine(527)-N(7))-methyltransferase RsmG [Bacteroidales bacterium]|nr:16S rRNA (guanine(527)-N(7))-methyltransferase RsmG [Bacteroidales bacterium]
MTTETIGNYFPRATEEQLAKFERLAELVKEWNEKINVISRKDTDNILEHHILHSLAIVKIIRFKEGTHVLDVGCGGGFPGLPLAIFFPDVKFHLIDSIGKKIKVVAAMAAELGLKNVVADHQNVIELKAKYDFVISRAVTSFPAFVEMAEHCVGNSRQVNGLPNGIIYLKGGDIKEEIAPFESRITILKVSDFFTEEYFETKKILYLQK